MKYVIDCPKYLIDQMIDATIASMKRASNTSKRPEFKEFYERDKRILENAKHSLAEVPEPNKK